MDEREQNLLKTMRDGAKAARAALRGNDPETARREYEKCCGSYVALEYDRCFDGDVNKLDVLEALGELLNDIEHAEANS